MEEHKPLLESIKQKNAGGFKTMLFIIANASLEKAATFGLNANMILYLENEYHMGMVTGTNIIQLWTAAGNFLPLVGAFFADTSVGRYPMIAFGSIVGLLGTILLWLTTMIPQARPPFCSVSASQCDPSTTFQMIILCFSLGLAAIGVGGIRSASMAFGADQFVKRDNKEKSLAALESYFGWYYAASILAIIVSLTFVVYIQEKLGWQVGFGIPAVFMLLGALSFFSASSFYIRSNDTSSLITGFFRVIVASYRNRNFTFFSDKTNMYHHKKESALVVPSEKLRFLNKACIVVDPEKYLTGVHIPDSWSLCTVDQVEELKAVLKVIPLWSTGVLMSVTVSQGSITLVQTMSLDRHITSSFEIPAASLTIPFFIAAILSIIFYDRIIVPLASRMMGKPFYFTSKLKMGIGILLSILYMLVLAFIEYIRRGLAIKQGISDNAEAVANISALWIILPYSLIGIGEALNSVGQYEFYYSEFPKSMSSIASTMRDLSLSVGSLVAAYILIIVDQVSRSNGMPSWVSSNINQGHYDYYYLVISGLCIVNMLYYLLCSWAYGPCELVAVKDFQEQDVIRLFGYDNELVYALHCIFIGKNFCSILYGIQTFVGADKNAMDYVAL